MKCPNCNCATDHIYEGLGFSMCPACWERAADYESQNMLLQRNGKDFDALRNPDLVDRNDSGSRGRHHESGTSGQRSGKGARSRWAEDYRARSAVPF